MNRGSLVKIALVGLICAPLVLFKTLTLGALPDTGAQALDSIESFARRDGFVVEKVVPTTSGVQVDLARRECRALIKEVAPQGWDVSTMGVLAGDRSLAYLFRGELHSEQPTWRTWTAYRVWRALRLFGIETRRDVVYGIASTPECAASMVDWTHLSPTGRHPSAPLP